MSKELNLSWVEKVPKRVIEVLSPPARLALLALRKIRKEEETVN